MEDFVLVGLLAGGGSSGSKECRKHDRAADGEAYDYGAIPGFGLRVHVALGEDEYFITSLGRLSGLCVKGTGTA